jgi:hypothetical protein
MSSISRFETAARAGYIARGVVYLLIGYFFWTTGGGEATSTVMERLHDMPLGTPLLFLLAAGLFGYGLFRIYSAWADLKGKGSDAKGLFGRTGPMLSGLAHLALALLAIFIATNFAQAGGGDRQEDIASTAMTLPGGWLLVGAAGLIGFAAAFGNFRKAWSCQFMEDLSTGTPPIARFAGRAGYAARGLVFGLIGWQILSLAIGWGDRELGMEAALQELRGRDWLFPLVAIGLGAFGLFSFIMAGYAQIRNHR